VNGKRASRSHRVGPGGIRCICCRPANKALSKRIAAREQRRIARAEIREVSLSAYLDDLRDLVMDEAGERGDFEEGRAA
jgi:hypothetical protein